VPAFLSPLPLELVEVGDVRGEASSAEEHIDRRVAKGGVRRYPPEYAFRLPGR